MIAEWSGSVVAFGSCCMGSTRGRSADVAPEEAREALLREVEDAGLRYVATWKQDNEPSR
jgi:hypothetical protein